MYDAITYAVHTHGRCLTQALESNSVHYKKIINYSTNASQTFVHIDHTDICYSKTLIDIVC